MRMVKIDKTRSLLRAEQRVKNSYPESQKNREFWDMFKNAQKHKI